MATFVDSVVFVDASQAIMPPCNAPTASDFEEDNNTLIWANIAGEMRLYSYNGVDVQYQTLTLSGKTTV